MVMQRTRPHIGPLLLLLLMLQQQVTNIKCSQQQQLLTRLPENESAAWRPAAAAAVEKRVNNASHAAATTAMTTLEQTTNCLKMQCKFVCFNGRASEIAADIRKAEESSANKCATIAELRLYSYKFEEEKIARGFLKEYEDKVELFYIACSQVTHVEGGAFANGIFRELYLEDLRLVELQRDFFEGISSHFEALTVVQKTEGMVNICSTFLDLVKYQIKSLTVQVGLNCIRNLTSSSNLLNNLWYADFSYNNFSDYFTETTFSQLSMVEHLDLSHSNISYLPDYIFAGMTRSLEYLDISYNHLTTLSLAIFGWHAVPTELKLVANDNDWHCNCELQTTMKELYIYQTNKLVNCKTPEEYTEWYVFDRRLCAGEGSTDFASTNAPEYTTSLYCPRCGEGGGASGGADGTSEAPLIDINDVNKVTIRPHVSTTAEGFQPIVPTSNYNILVVECLPLLDAPNSNYQTIKRATVQFDLHVGLDQVDVIVHSTFTMAESESYGLIWFSNVTKQYYNMEVNYNEYGLGCFGSISYHTIVDNLLPDECYTFCVVLQDQKTMSPFNCKSAYIAGNLAVNTWETGRGSGMGIALMVFGIILFCFIGIVAIFMLIKHKPTLLKGSKRVATSTTNPAEIVVYPKDKKSFRHKQEQLAKRCSRVNLTCNKRRGSSDSTATYQSYMDTNLYEVIPAYLQFDNSYTDIASLPEAPSPPSPPPFPELQSANTNMSPFDTEPVSYAEIPRRSMRSFDDPVAEVPMVQRSPRDFDSADEITFQLDSNV